MQTAGIHEIAWFFRILLLTIAPVKCTLEILLSAVSSILLFAGKPIDSVNFLQYGQPKHLTTARVKYLVTVFDSCAAYARKLLKYLSDKDLGLKPDLPPIKNLFHQRTKH